MLLTPRGFPNSRLRRLRSAAWSRDLVAETTLQKSDLIYPIFIREPGAPEMIDSMPGVRRYTLDALPDLIHWLVTAGICAVCLFPVIPFDQKNATADACLDADGLLIQAIGIIKNCNQNIGIITDAALDSYTDHGHDGIWVDGDVDNDLSLKRIAEHALIQAQAGADVIAPSDMMDGRVSAIRAILDQNGYQKVSILSYSAKYASAFYGPFRDALQSGTCLKTSHKKSYQMDPANGCEALHEVAQDLAEGADMVMIKPGLAYLDVVASVRQTFQVPTIAFHVSGEYAMLKAAAQAGWLNYDAAIWEVALAFKRAGATAIITYAALDLISLIEEKRS